MKPVAQRLPTALGIGVAVARQVNRKAAQENIISQFITIVAQVTRQYWSIFGETAHCDGRHRLVSVGGISDDRTIGAAACGRDKDVHFWIAIPVQIPHRCLGDGALCWHRGA